MTDTASGTATTTDKTPLTGYVILAEQKRPSANTVTSAPTGGWEIVARDITARNAGEAVRKYAEKHAEKKSAVSDESRVFVAIAARSWKPLRVTPKVTTSLDIAEAS